MASHQQSGSPRASAQQRKFSVHPRQPHASVATKCGNLHSVYRFVFWLILRHLPAEFAHKLGFGLLRLTASMPGGLALLRAMYRAPVTPISAMGLTFPGPLGLAAGFDKNAEGYEALAALGFAFVEVGTITAHAQPGNPTPRLFRLPRDRALINRFGFNNEGAAACAERLRGPRTTIVGVNIGKTKVADDATSDYVTSTTALAPLADYLVVNVSSPNTPGLRSLQAREQLEPLLIAVRNAADAATPGRRVPLLVKIAPDLADEDIDDLADMALHLGLDGIIATNTTLSRAGLQTDAAHVAALGAGGLSGAPLAERSLAVLRRLRAKVGSRIVLISVGGIASIDDVRARIQAGATLVQAYSAFVYEGPGFAAKIARAWHREQAKELA